MTLKPALAPGRYTWRGEDGVSNERKQGFKGWKDLEGSSEERRRKSHLDESSAAFRRVSPWIV